MHAGRPGVGKTTCLRECARIVSETHAQRVVIVDSSNEVCFLDHAVTDLGFRVWNAQMVVIVDTSNEVCFL